MKVILVEDEAIAAARLQDILGDIDPTISVMAVLPSVRETVDWLLHHPPPDAGFFDIQLADDHSFEIFRQYPVDFPVIFTTAFDDYLLQAFEYHAVHYLLKPLVPEKVRQAVSKIGQLQEIWTSRTLKELLQEQTADKGYRRRLVLRRGQEYVPVATEEIAYFFTEEGLCFARTYAEDTFIIDQNLKDIHADLDPSRFFRVNRQYLVHINAIQGFRSIEQSKIKLELRPLTRETVLISKENAVAFRKWISH